MSIDFLFNKKYDLKKYNCLHFVVDAWKIITDKDISLEIKNRKYFKRIKMPKTPCLVIMKNNIGTSQPHIGIWLNSKILHICARGVEFLPKECVIHGYSTIRYYECLN